MAGGRTLWWMKDSGWWRREHIVELGEEFGPAGPAVIDWLSCEAKVQDDGGFVKAGRKSVARGCFVDVVTVGHVLSRGVTLGLLEDMVDEGGRFSLRISGWKADNERGQATARKRAERDRNRDESSVSEPNSEPGHGVTDRDMSRSVTLSHLRLEKRRVEKKETSSPVEPVRLDAARDKLKTEQVKQVFDAWVQATGRDASRTKLSPDRRRRIEKALASHGLDDCLAAVAHIGQDDWAAGANDRGRPFNDIEHALGDGERIERWRDWQPIVAGRPVQADGQYDQKIEVVQA